MLPIKLQLHNFMSYGENVEPLDFRGLDLVCFSGYNGVGKSSLLEAITWALWGKARAKSDDDLIRLGSEEMWVDFEFELEGARYRAIRKRIKKKKKKGGFATSGSFDFMIFGGASSGENQSLNIDEENWRSLSEQSKAETQDKVIKTLRMDYDTFINSAFLRQGHADEFTIKKPIERKAILADILGLSYYDQLQERAKELRRSRDVEKESSEQLVENLSEELDLKENCVEEEKKIKNILNKAQIEIEAKEKEVEKLISQRSVLEIKKKEIKDLNFKIEELENEIENLGKEFEKKEKEFQKIKDIISNKKEIEKNYNELQDLKKKNDELTKVRLKQFSLESKKNQLNNKISDSKKKIEIEQANILEKIKEYGEDLKNKDKIEKELKLSQNKINEFVKLEKKKQENIKRVQVGSEKKMELKTQKSQIQALGVELKQKIETIEGSQGTCPTCSQKLDEKHKQKVLSDLNKEISDKREKYKKLDETEKTYDSRILELQNEIKKLEQKLIEQKAEEKKFYSLEKSLEELKNKERDLNNLKEKNKNLISEMEKGNFDLESVRELAKIENELKGLIYNEKEHKEIELGINKLLSYEKMYNDLVLALEKEKGNKEYLEKNKNDRKKANELLKESKERHKKLIVEAKDLDFVMSQLIEENKDLQELRMQISSIQSEYGAIKEKLDRLKLQETELKDRKKKLKKASMESSIYNELAQAFSKTGIQAMIIESAIPEIEDEANKLLSKMTDGRLEVKFLTQREKKTDGALQETLDIQIIDEQGNRDYEMFSGGEAFRINFAIRIALSKLLAKRSGAKLQLLVIDEGFGTQDNIGQEYVIDAINSIKNDFKKILIITHIQSLKDMFQSRIEVTKDEEGSRFEVVS